MTNHSGPHPTEEDDIIDDEELSQCARDADIDSRIAREREREQEKKVLNTMHRIHYIVWCSEHGRVSVWASRQVAEPQRNWHELQHLEGVMGKQTVVQVQVIAE